MIKIVTACWLLLFSTNLWADDMRPASLTITALDNNRFDVIWKVPAKGKQRLKLDVTFDISAEDITKKRMQLLPGAYIEQWEIKREQGLAGLQVNILGLIDSSADVLLRIIDSQKQTATAVLNTDNQSYLVPAKIEQKNTVITYITLGVEHILIGLDHLLFVACLIYISSTRKKLILTITGFTLAHSITLIMAATGVWSIPIAPVEAVIALSIVFLAIEIAKNNQQSISLRYPVLVSSSFGLLHGFGFASVLAEIGLPLNEKVTALLCFNIGVEIGQLLFVASLFLVYRLLLVFKQNLTMDKLRHVTSYSCGSIATYWLIERLIAFS